MDSEEGSPIVVMRYHAAWMPSLQPSIGIKLAMQLGCTQILVRFMLAVIHMRFGQVAKEGAALLASSIDGLSSSLGKQTRQAWQDNSKYEKRWF